MLKPEIEIREFESLTTTEICPEEAQIIQSRYSGKLDISRPLLGGGYILKAGGWVGRIELDNFCVAIQPKVPISNLFWMLERAYKEIKSFKGKIDISSMTDIIESLMGILASKSLDLAFQGLHRSYISCEDTLPWLRGRLDINGTLKAMRNCCPNLSCNFHEHTTDILENRAIAWTLWCLSRIGIRREEIKKHVFKAFRTYLGAAEIGWVTSEQVRQIKYNRLNESYRQAHALCLFFLEKIGPLHPTGEKNFFPFLIDMEGVFEKYIASVLKDKMPDSFLINEQESRFFDDSKWLRIQVDIIVRNSATKKVVAVIDTKYKLDEKPSNDDVFQVFAYAQSIGASNAILIYPWTNIERKTIHAKGCRIFPIGIDLSNENMNIAESDLIKKVVNILQE